MGNKSINYDFKLFSAVAMVLVVAGHILPWNTSVFYGLFPLYTFHVAAFVFVTGYFYKPEHEERLADFFVKKVRTLVIPMYVIYTLYAVVLIAMQHMGFTYGPKEITWQTLLIMPWTNGLHIRLNKPMWFIGALFVAESINILLRKAVSRIVKNKTALELGIFVLYMIIGAIGMHYGSQGNGVTGSPNMAIWRACFFLACIGMGRVYRCFIESHDTCSNTMYFSVIIAIQLALLLSGHNINCNVSRGYFPSGVLVTYVQAITGIAALLRVCKILGPQIGSSKTVLAVADNTFSIMNHHYFVFILLSAALGGLSLLGVPFLGDFSWQELMSHDMYFFLPAGQKAFVAVYIALGLAVPIFTHKLWTRLKGAVMHKDTQPAASK